MPETGWVDFGTATFADPIVITATSYSPVEYAYTVGVEKNENVEGLYRLVNPYIGSPVAAANSDSEGQGSHLCFNTPKSILRIYFGN